MPIRLEFEGLDDLREALKRLPQELAEKASTVVKETAQQVGSDVIANYPDRSGNLRSGVSVKVTGSSVSTTGIVRSASPHAHLYENGTARRQTDRGYNRGVMPRGPNDALVGVRAGRARRKMYDQLKDVVQQAGDFTVSET